MCQNSFNLSHYPATWYRKVCRAEILRALVERSGLGISLSGSLIPFFPLMFGQILTASLWEALGTLILNAMGVSCFLRDPNYIFVGGFPFGFPLKPPTKGYPQEKTRPYGHTQALPGTCLVSPTENPAWAEVGDLFQLGHPQGERREGSRPQARRMDLQFVTSLLHVRFVHFRTKGHQAMADDLFNFGNGPPYSAP